MKICIAFDDTISFRSDAIATLFNRNCKNIKCTPFEKPLSLGGDFVDRERFPSYFESVKEKADVSIIFTLFPYDNNFFFEGYGSRYVVSLSGWDFLTKIPQSNGVVYFICSILLRNYFEIGDRHSSRNTGCMNDFLSDKRGVDFGMRAAFLCESCTAKARSAKQRQALIDLRPILNLLSAKSRLGLDILLGAHPDVVSNAEEEFDVFLCHNSIDKPEIRVLNTRLRRAKIKTWLDEKQLPLGKPWQPELERQINKIASALVFVGESGIGPWENAEIRAFLSEFITRDCPVTPVILPNAGKIPELPIFLRQMNYVDLRRDPDEGIKRIVRWQKSLQSKRVH